jgi:hypothetical protein
VTLDISQIEFRSENRRHFWKKKEQYLTVKVNDLHTERKNRNIRSLYRDINEFKKGRQSGNNFVMSEMGDHYADSRGILNRWTPLQNCEKQLLASLCPSVRLSACNNSAPTGRILMKLDILAFFENLSRKFNFH